MSKNILDIYSEYKIMPNLAEHMLRVSAVAKQICDAQNSSFKKVNTENVVKACLLHDMGNIIKFKLGDLVFFAQDGLEAWEPVKQEFIAKYGNNEHLATIKICEEIGVSEEVKSILENIGFSNAPKVLNEKKLENMIANYADQRVSPYKITSLEERVSDGKKRYADRIKENPVWTDENFQEKVNALNEIENLLFKDINMKPEQINDESSKVVIENLKKYEI